MSQGNPAFPDFQPLRWAINFFVINFLWLPLTAYASFIEATIGTAVVNDATAAYHNPAALTLLDNSQFIALDSLAYHESKFSGQAVQVSSHFTQSGIASSHTSYHLPSLYLGLPVTSKAVFGFAVLSNFFNNDIDDTSILRYAQSSNHIKNVDLVPAFGFKINNYLSLGAGLNFSYAEFILEPLSGIPSLNIPDSQSRNESVGHSLGGAIGILIRPHKSTLIGFNYKSVNTYHLNGKSVLENSQLSSNHYHFVFWTPARSVVSINHFITPKFGFIGTAQYIQGSIIKNVNLYNIAVRIGTQPVILPHAVINFHLHNSWIFTFGSHYKMTPNWIIRIAGSYVESPGNNNFQIVTGDSYILGASMAYKINNHIIFDGSYAHAFIQNENIHIANRNMINGVNKAFRDSISLKLTLNV